MIMNALKLLWEYMTFIVLALLMVLILDTSILHHYFYIIFHSYSSIYIVFGYDTYVISSLFACLMIIGENTAGAWILLEKAP
jgi:hypothetical protein